MNNRLHTLFSLLLCAVVVLGGFSYAHADSVIVAYLPATTTAEVLAIVPNTFSPYTYVGQSFVLGSANTITGADFLLQGVLGESFTATLGYYNGSNVVIVATSTSAVGGVPYNIIHFTFSPYTAVAGNYIVGVKYNNNGVTGIYGTRSNAFDDG